MQDDIELKSVKNGKNAKAMRSFNSCPKFIIWCTLKKHRNEGQENVPFWHSFTLIFCPFLFV